MKTQYWNPYIFGKNNGLWNNKAEFYILIPNKSIQRELSEVREYQDN